MKTIRQAYLKLMHYSKNVKSIYEIIFSGIFLIIPLVISILSTNAVIEKWASFFLGLAIGYILIKLPAIIAYFKGKPETI